MTPPRIAVASWLSEFRRSMAAVTGTIVLVDQASKAAVKQLVSLHDSINVIPGLLNLTHVRNTGAAFGILNTTDFAYKPAVMTAVAFVALVALGTYAARTGLQGRAARVGLALILGGAFGNLIDRIAFGHVVDFVDVYWRTYHFWAFNVADAAITVGAGCLLIDTLKTEHHDVSDTA